MALPQVEYSNQFPNRLGEAASNVKNFGFDTALKDGLLHASENCIVPSVVEECATEPSCGDTTGELAICAELMEDVLSSSVDALSVTPRVSIEPWSIHRNSWVSSSDSFCLFSQGKTIFKEI